MSHIVSYKYNKTRIYFAVHKISIASIHIHYLGERVLFFITFLFVVSFFCGDLNKWVFLQQREINTILLCRAEIHTVKLPTTTYNNPSSANNIAKCISVFVFVFILFQLKQTQRNKFSCECKRTQNKRRDDTLELHSQSTNSHFSCNLQFNSSKTSSNELCSVIS